MLLIGQTCRLASSFFHCCHYGLYTGMNSGLFSLLHTCCGHYGYLNTHQFLGEYNLIFISTNYILRLFLIYLIACHLTTKTYHYLTTINFVRILFYFSFKFIFFSLKVDFLKISIDNSSSGVLFTITDSGCFSTLI